MISDICGDENYMKTGNIVAATPEIFNMMTKKINSK